MSSEKILISACLMGENVKYDGGNNALHVKILEQWKDEGRLVLVCPEVLGGLSTPRHPCEVVHGENRVVNTQGEDVTDAFLKGAGEALLVAQKQSVCMAILKARSPSCGKDVIYDGTFSHTHVRDSGFTCKALQKAGITVFSEEEFVEAEAFLRAKEA
ncbi:DUF523 domain-containing protein [Sulfurospirillum barnesii]|uniref:Uncharacterized protein n=1 Tax=Sulfurospirillum barnesii (strain ATCC 700032 / DSM 10660 / SES-3) TaxID=760154 RepID=I3XZC3_SULBS|nr:DUF523 domain-containing protein [Sulfurospirillum barnesii]AFL69297.1 hypothetical protein Sulba_2018 [Sulfurospirillum barnesii SES-3]